jgi:putative transcriptional regulator
MSMATNEQIPEVAPLRLRLGWTQTELARQLGVSQPLVAMWESGDRKPSGPAAILLRQLDKQNPKKNHKRA